jgi:5,10-methylenetetrahydromethanopterin reductase
MLSDELTPGELIELVELAEAVGYGELWYTDQRFWRDCYAGLTLAAQHSRHLRLGPGVNDPRTRHPATIAMSIATLDELSAGRALLGLGVGGSGIAEMRLPRQRPVRALREAIELIRAMLAGETVRFEGEIFQLDGGKLGFRPPSAVIPIYVASHSPQVLRLTGQVADGVLLGNMARREAVEEAAAIVREGERSADRPPGTVAIELRLEACIGDDERAALAAMKRRFAVRLVATYPRWAYLDSLGVRPSDDLRRAAQTQATEAVADLLSDADVRATALVGSPEDAAHQLRSLMTPEVAGVTIRPYTCVGQGFDATIRAFAERVWPSVVGAIRTPSGC